MFTDLGSIIGILEDAVLIHCVHEGRQYLIAYDQATESLVWDIVRESKREQIVRSVEGVKSITFDYDLSSWFVKFA